MRQCGTEQLKEGMVLARPIYDQHYRKLLAEGSALNGQMISRIRQIGFRYIYVQEPGTENIVVEDLIGIRCRQEATHALEMLADIEKMAHKRLEGGGSRSNPAYVRMMKEHQDLVQKALKSILSDLMYARHPVYFPGIYLAKDQLINHSTDVAILSMLIGIGFGFTTGDLMLLGKAALFHDVGKLRLDPELTYKHPSDLSEDQVVLYRMHPQMGAVLLEQDTATDIHVTMGIIQHHELQDGSGFPEGVKGAGEQPKSATRTRGTIHRFAEIIAVADYFDNLVGGRVEQFPILPHEAVGRILKKTPGWFNPHIVQMAVSMINVFPEGSNVEVRDTRQYGLVGYRGVVAKTNPENLNRPTIMLLFDTRHQRLDKPIMVDFADDNRVKLEYLYDL